MIRRMASVLLVIFLVIAISGCAKPESEFLIKIDGPMDLKAQGQIMTVKASGSSSSQSFNASDVAEIKVKAHTVSVVVQNQKDTGWIKVEIFKDGKVVQSAETRQPFGVVSVASN